MRVDLDLEYLHVEYLYDEKDYAGYCRPTVDPLVVVDIY